MKPGKTTELLAPAGSIDTFYAAIDAGADAVYVGLTAFNARLRAKNFSAKTLAHLVPLAHSHNVKVYVTFNTLVKQRELESAIHTLYQLEQIGIDALIVADLGIIRIARDYFPGLTLHASTQMAIHNSAGVATAAGLGIKRVILARELTIEEISTICRQSPIEIETFVHGALCYSLSGACLASSFLGGFSGNRGRCTQVCRRIYATPDSRGSFFSPRDLCALSVIPKLSAAGVASLKIEGRMKGPHYLSTVVSAYRAALDHPGEIPRLAQEVQNDLGREKTSFFLPGLNPTDPIIEARGKSGIGRFLGPIASVTVDSLTIVTDNPVSPGDTIRIQPASGYEGKSLKVLQVQRSDTHLRIGVQDCTGHTPGDTVYVIERDASPRRQAGNHHSVTPVRFRESCGDAQRILRSFNPRHASVAVTRQNRLYLKIDSPAWLDAVAPEQCDGLILAFDLDQFDRCLNDSRLIPWQGRISMALPVFIPEDRLDRWSKTIETWSRRHDTLVHVGNLGAVRLAPQSVRLQADALLYSLNRPARLCLQALGLRNTTASWEDDIPNLRAAAPTGAFAYIYGYPPLFTSRIPPAVAEGARLKDPAGREFFVSQRYGMYHLLGSQPLCLFHRVDKFNQAGISRFIIDLSFHEPDRVGVERLVRDFQSRVRVPHSSDFNFRSELK